MKRNDQIDELLRTALAEYVESELARLPSDAEIGTHKFSKSFERKMQRLIDSEHKSYGFMVRTTGRRVISVLVAVMLLTTTALFSVSATRGPIVTFFTEAYDKFTAVFFDKPETTTYSDESDPLEEITVGYIPEGFELRYESRSERSCLIEYANEGEHSLIITVRPIGEAGLTFDTEGVEVVSIEVNGYDGIYYYQKGISNVMWNDNNRYYIIRGDLDYNAIMEVAESIS